MQDQGALMTLLSHLFTLMSENNQGLKEYLVELYALMVSKQSSGGPDKAIEFLTEQQQRYFHLRNSPKMYSLLCFLEGLREPTI